MNTFSWLLISDLHLKSNYTTWSQSVVLRDMVRDIEAHQPEYPPIRFVIVSGDLAHGGKADEYLLVEAFLDSLLGVLGLERSDLFIVPGNHDIDRDINRLAFHGARAVFLDPDNVEHYLSDSRERGMLAARLADYYAFEQRVCPHLLDAYTDDRLAYFSNRLIGDLPIGVIGFNSAIACGDDSDHGTIIIGDRPVIDVCEKVRGADVRLIVAIVHHPPVWLAEFDQRTFDSRFLPFCDILHRGHLHEHDVRPTATLRGTNCLVISAGAGLVRRQSPNTYSIISMDVAAANCTVVNCAYDPHSGRYRPVDSQSHPIRLRGDIPGDAQDLAHAIREVDHLTEQLSPYLTAIVEGKATEIPLPINGAVYFGSPNLLAEVEDAAYVECATALLQVRNSLLAFPAATPIAQRVSVNGETFKAFAATLMRLSKTDEAFRTELERRILLAVQLCSLQPESGTSTFIAALDQVAIEGDWGNLESLARRYATNESPEVSRVAYARLALALCHSEDPEQQTEALSIAERLISESDASVAEYELAFAINRNQRHDDRCEVILLQAIGTFADLPMSFKRSAYTFVAETGRLPLRSRLEQLEGGSDE